MKIAVNGITFESNDLEKIVDFLYQQNPKGDKINIKVETESKERSIKITYFLYTWRNALEELIPEVRELLSKEALQEHSAIKTA